jgi:DNA methyltransferase 1-associated protein 1
MAISSNDIRAVLPDGPKQNGLTQSKSRKYAGSIRPEGIPRELYTLIGDSTPSILAQSRPRLKQKPKPGEAIQMHWELREFNISQRLDSLRLQHWVKSSDPQPENKGISVSTVFSLP